MAIKVGGTTVVDDSRQLTNIASVDATTVAALGAAGISGGGGIELTTSESVVEGDTLSFNFDTGKVGKTGRVGAYGSSNTSTNAFEELQDIIYISSIDRFVVSYRNASNGTTGVRVGTQASDGTITWGTATAGESAALYSGHKLVYDTANNLLIHFYRVISGLRSRVYTINSSTNVATSQYANDVTTSTVNIGAGKTKIAGHYNASTGKVLVGYRLDSSSDHYVHVGTVGASSQSWSSGQGYGGGNNFGAYLDNFVMTDIGGSTIIFAWQKANSTNVRQAVAGTLSGTTLTFGSLLQLSTDSAANDHVGSIFHWSHSTQANNRVGYISRDNSLDPVNYQFTVSGNTLTYDQTYSLGNLSNAYGGATAAYNPSNGMIYMWDGTVRVAQGSDPYDGRQTANTDLATTRSSANTLIRATAYNPTQNYAVAIDENDYIHYYQPIVDNYLDFIGVAKEAASADSTVKIANAGQIATGLSGLTAGNAYRINYDGTFTNLGITDNRSAFNGTQRDRVSGRALTSTTMLMMNDFMST